MIDERPDPIRLVYNLDFPHIQDFVNERGLPSYRADQIWRGLYHSLWGGPDEFTILPSSQRNLLGSEFTFTGLHQEHTQISQDGKTIKTLFRLTDGLLIEAVLMRYNKRRTLCISTQAGCAMGCVFCATGQMGFQRNLSSGEIVEQVLYYARQLKSTQEKVTNVVLMGMGEPFHNYEATMESIDRLNHPMGFALGARRFTVSTVGHLPGIRRFTAENRQVNLAVSLHATEDTLRASMLPINKRYPIAELIQACRDYVAQTHRRISFEWALIRDVNDSPRQAQKLAELLQGLLCHVNVIPLNPTARYEGQATSTQRAIAFRDELVKYGIPCSIRLRRGIDIQAGCGQLANQH